MYYRETRVRRLDANHKLGKFPGTLLLWIPDHDHLGFFEYIVIHYYHKQLAVAQPQKIVRAAPPLRNVVPATPPFGHEPKYLANFASAYDVRKDQPYLFNPRACML